MTEALQKSSNADVTQPVGARDLAATEAVRDIMRPVVVTLRPEADLETAGSMLVNLGLDAAPVVDLQGRPLGQLALRDIVREVVESAEWQPTRMRVKQLMSRNLTLVPMEVTVAQAAAGLAGAATSTAVVVSRTGRLVGMLHASDVLAWLASRAGYAARAAHHMLQLSVGVR